MRGGIEGRKGMVGEQGMSNNGMYDVLICMYGMYVLHYMLYIKNLRLYFPICI